MADLSTSIDSLINFVNQRWYVILIVGLLGALALAILNILKLKGNQVKYFDQVKENKERLIDVLGFNPTTIKYIIHVNKKYKVLGELWLPYVKNPVLELRELVTRPFNDAEIKEKQFNYMKEFITKKEHGEIDKKVAHIFLVTSGSLAFLGIGKKELLLFRNEELSLSKHDTIRINDNVRLMYDNGLKVTTHQDMIGVTTDLTYKLMSDHIINAMGQQQKDFSRIRTDYSHEEVMKDKEIEAEEKKDKAKRHG